MGTRSGCGPRLDGQVVACGRALGDESLEQGALLRRPFDLARALRLLLPIPPPLRLLLPVLACLHLRQSPGHRRASHQLAERTAPLVRRRRAASPSGRRRGAGATRGGAVAARRRREGAPVGGGARARLHPDEGRRGSGLGEQPQERRQQLDHHVARLGRRRNGGGVRRGASELR